MYAFVYSGWINRIYILAEFFLIVSIACASRADTLDDIGISFLHIMCNSYVCWIFFHVHVIWVYPVSQGLAVMRLKIFLVYSLLSIGYTLRFTLPVRCTGIHWRPLYIYPLYHIVCIYIYHILHSILYILYSIYIKHIVYSRYYYSY